MYNHTNEISIHWTKILCVVCVYQKWNSPLSRVKFQWSIQSSHTQVVLSQVVYLNYRNERIWPPTRKWLHIFETFHLASLQFTTFDHFLSLYLILRLMSKIFDILFCNMSFLIFQLSVHITFEHVQSHKWNKHSLNKSLVCCVCVSNVE